MRSLRSFQDDYPESKALLLYRGADRLAVEGIRVVPVEEFLLGLDPSRGRLA
jgi:hypothetical protein